MVSIKDVARHAGVAISTVSKVLNNYPNISEATRKKVYQAVEETNPVTPRVFLTTYQVSSFISMFTST